MKNLLLTSLAALGFPLWLLTVIGLIALLICHEIYEWLRYEIVDGLAEMMSEQWFCYRRFLGLVKKDERSSWE